jgi:hypothetical protein
MSTHR